MVDKFVNKDGKEVLIVNDDNTVFIDKELKDKKKKEFKDDSAKSKVLPKDKEDTSNC